MFHMSDENRTQADRAHIDKLNSDIDPADSARMKRLDVGAVLTHLVDSARNAKLRRFQSLGGYAQSQRQLPRGP